VLPCSTVSTVTGIGTTSPTISIGVSAVPMTFVEAALLVAEAVTIVKSVASLLENSRGGVQKKLPQD
jgi:hypothetical protein